MTVEAVQFRLATEEFWQGLKIIRNVVGSVDVSTNKPSIRAGAAKGSMLLLAAYFEDYIQELAVLNVQCKVETAQDIGDLPTQMLRALWQKTFDSIAREKLPQATNQGDIAKVLGKAESESESLFKFLRGDLGQEIYKSSIQSQGGMYPRQINDLFKIGGDGSICQKVAADKKIRDFLGQDSEEASYRELCMRIENFIRQRNEVAHRLSRGQSIGRNDLMAHIDMFVAFSSSLCCRLIEQNKGYLEFNTGEQSSSVT